MGTMTTVPAGFGQAPILGDECQAQNVAPSATQSVGVSWDWARGSATGFT
jgi:hypothetical protein